MFTTTEKLMGAGSGILLAVSAPTAAPMTAIRSRKAAIRRSFGKSRRDSSGSQLSRNSVLDTPSLK